MWLIQYAIFGLVAGAIARMLHPGRDPMNWFWTMVLGIGGSVLGGWLGAQLGFPTEKGLTSWAAAIGGSVLLLIIYHFATARNATSVNGPATDENYKRAVYDDLSRGPRS
jgi:uncharacterized membrane protein YeaQ/YmgE (transglycosylase-associated protein family)